MRCEEGSRIRRARESCMKGYWESSRISTHLPQHSRGELQWGRIRNSVGRFWWTNVERFEDVGYTNEDLRVGERSSGTFSTGDIKHKARVSILAKKQYRLPKPKNISRGSVTSAASFPSFMNRFGLKVEADGYNSSSRIIPLQRQHSINNAQAAVNCQPTRY